LWTVVNVAIGVLLGMFAARVRRRPSRAKALLFHWLLFAWTAWCAFPWFGEGL
jgi:hypothetical protein